MSENLQCPVCGIHSQYQPMPSYKDLANTNTKQKERISDLECFLQDFILEQGLKNTGFVQRARRLMRLSDNLDKPQNR